MRNNPGYRGFKVFSPDVSEIQRLQDFPTNIC